MFKISIIETHSHRRMVVEGTLIAPWTAELQRAWTSAGERLEGRRLIVDLGNVTLISRDGESVLMQMMKEGAKFSTRDVLTRHVLKQMARKCRCSA